MRVSSYNLAFFHKDIEENYPSYSSKAKKRQQIMDLKKMNQAVTSALILKKFKIL